MADNVVSRGFTQVTFTDQYGEERTIYRQKGQALRIKKRADSISHVLNRSAAIMVGQRIKAKRIERGYTLDELLIRAGLTAAPGCAKQRMHEIESAGNLRKTATQKQGIRFGTLYALAMALECPVADLLPSSEDVQKHAGVGLTVVAAPRVVLAA